MLGERVKEPRAQVVAAAVVVGGVAIEPIEIVELRLSSSAPATHVSRSIARLRARALLAQLLALARLELRRGSRRTSRSRGSASGTGCVARAKKPASASARLLVGGAEQPVDRRALGLVGDLRARAAISAARDRVGVGARARAGSALPVAGVAGAAIDELGVVADAGALRPRSPSPSRRCTRRSCASLTNAATRADQPAALFGEQVDRCPARALSAGCRIDRAATPRARAESRGAETATARGPGRPRPRAVDLGDRRRPRRTASFVLEAMRNTHDARPALKQKIDQLVASGLRRPVHEGHAAASRSAGSRRPS